MEYCCHVWEGASSCYLNILDKLQKWVCRTVGPSLAASPLTHSPNIASVKSFYRYYFVDDNVDVAELVLHLSLDSF